MSTAVAPHAVAARLAAVRDRIEQAARRAGRRPGDVGLVAVSKTFGPDAVREALAAGVTDLGENRVQEAEEKVPAVGQPARWHLIGHLQKNKVNKALDLFDLIQSVDSAELAASIGQRAVKRGKPAGVLLQVNVAEKDGQFGFGEADLRGSAAELAGMKGLSVDGLMCIAPLVEDPEEARPAFRQLARLHGELSGQMRGAGHPWRHLSMGMSNDYVVAIEEGATLVRVGRAIFGERGK
jgi:PLP dependent protein